MTSVVPDAARKYVTLCVASDLTFGNRLAHELHEHWQNYCEFESVGSAEEALLRYQELMRAANPVWLVISELMLPKMLGDELLANIHEFDPHSMKLLLFDCAVTEQLGRNINHAGLSYYLLGPWQRDELELIMHKLKFQYEMSTVLNETNRRFASSFDLEETLQAVFFNIVNVIQAEAGSIFLVDPFTNTLVCRVCHGPTDIKGMHIPIGTGIVGHVAATGELDITMDVKHDVRHNPHIDQQTGFVTKSMASVPLIDRDKVIGVIQVINKQGEQHFSHDDISLLQSLSSGGALAIRNAQHAKLLLQEERIRSELLIAHQIQQGILPEAFAGHPAIHFDAVNEPVKEVGGDFYDYFQINDDEFVFFIGDVCGKGVPAAIFMASVRSIIKSQALSDAHPAKVIPLANRLITEDAQSGMFVTAFYGVYNINTRLLRFINAGHPPALLFRPATASCSALLNANTPLGFSVNVPVSFEFSEIQLEKGDRLVLHTDGIDEAVNMQEEFFGMERLIQLILTHGDRSAKELQENIIRNVKTFSGGQEQSDDMTVMIVQV